MCAHCDGESAACCTSAPRSSRKSEAVISREIAKLRDGHMTPDIVFRDPYLLDLLGLRGAYSERDLESAILREIEGVLLELGTGFAFIARQKRMSIGKDDFHLDLLFFHRHLHRLIAVELKLESFKPAHVGQMELPCAGWTSTSAQMARKPQLDSSCVPPPMPSRWSCSSSMPNPSASASTSRSCRRCRCCAPACTRRSSTPRSRRPSDCPTRRVGDEKGATTTRPRAGAGVGRRRGAGRRSLAYNVAPRSSTEALCSGNGSHSRFSPWAWPPARCSRAPVRRHQPVVLTVYSDSSDHGAISVPGVLSNSQPRTTSRWSSCTSRCMSRFRRRETA